MKAFSLSPHSVGALLALLAAAPSLSAADVIINEIMYHPSSENVREEYIELYNKGATAVDLDGWRLSKGVEFTFTNAVLAPGAYLVVAADLAVFQTKYPGVANVTGSWTGTLRNGGETLELRDRAGQVAQSLSYANEGEWGIRRRGLFQSGSRGWEWFADHDGLGKSLELQNPELPNDAGQNWAASIPFNGTPGIVNSVRSANIAPLILDAAHGPAIPRSTDPVTITARVRDESAAGVTVTLFYRDHSSLFPPSFLAVPMSDDGTQGDGQPGDGLFGVVLPPFPDQTVVEFYIEAADASTNRRTWPAPAAVALDQFGPPTQSANAIFQVDDGVYAGPQPVYRIILTESERIEFLNMDRNSDAQMNATFVTVEGTGTRLRYNCGLRIRGASSRNRTPPNYRLNIPDDALWNDVDAINLNTQFTHSQLLGSQLAEKAGMVAANARAVQVRLNGFNQAFDTPQPGNIASWQFGSYVHLEVFDSQWATRHLPDNDGGNIYRASTGAHNANLSYGTTPDYFLNRGYSKSSNQSENDWSDLIHLTDVLNNTPDSGYLAAVPAVVDVQLWMRYFAVMSMLASLETSIATGQGDDYSMYRGGNDPRFILLPHDLDTCMGEGDSGAQPGAALFRMINPPNSGAVVPVLNRFMTNNAYAPIYFRELKRMLDTTFSPAQFNALADRVLGGWVPQTDIDRMKNFQVQRNNSVRSQMPLTLTATSSLPVLNGYSLSTSGLAGLNGRANVLETSFILVNGLSANWLAWLGTWSLPGVTLTPGINRILVQAFDGATNEVQRVSYDVWYNDGSVSPISGSVGSDTTWTAAAGPYLVTGTLSIAPGATLTIEPGTSVYFAPGAGLEVSGALNAQGTASRHIRFTRPPGTTGSWAGFNFEDTPADNRIAYADFDFADGGAATLNVASSSLILEHVTWANTTKTILVAVGSSVALRDSVLPTLANATHILGNFIPSGGFFIIERNVFGGAGQLNDVINFRGGQRPGRLLQVLDNVFTAASDDVLDLDGTDAHIEGNVFLHVHKNNAVAGDSSSAIAFGRYGGYAPHVVAVRNLFLDVDHVALVKDGGALTLANNTAVGLNIAALNFSEPELGSLPGARAFVEGNIFLNPPGYAGSNFQNRLPANGSVQLVLARNIFAAADGVTNGVDANLLTDPRLANADPSSITPATIARDFSLLPGSPALRSGPNGIDRGALVPPGASLSGEPPSPTAARTATLTVAGPGITNYLFRVNNGPFSPQRSIDVPIALSGLADGAYTVEVLGVNSAGVVQAAPTRSRAWTVNTGPAQVRIHEVLARNDDAVPIHDAFPDLIELHNPGAAAVALGGFGLTDDPASPYKFAFPAGTLIGPDEYLVVYAAAANGPGLYAGFGLDQDGDGVYLYAPPAAGGELVDSVQFGPQVANLSIGRMPGGDWALTQPTFGGPNVPQSTGDPRRLRINEWLAAALSAFPSDFVELYNGDSLPVGVGGLYLTDEPGGAPRRQQLAPLSFIGANAHLVYLADSDAAAGASHLGFKLSPDQGLIALLAPDLSVIDSVTYGPQTVDVSEGRSPSGGTAVGFFPNPTPGAGNPATLGTNGVFTVVLNEVLASNDSVTNSDGTITDWVELLSGPTNTVDLSGMSLSDNPALPRRWVIPGGVTLAPGGRLVVRFDPDTPASTNNGPVLNTGFGLDAGGDQVYLFDTPARTGALLDSVVFGLQAAGLSIGRVPDGTGPWLLNRVTRGAPNIAAGLGSAAQLRINEWLADPDSGDDWFELFNPNPQPAALGGMSFTDDLSLRAKSRVPPLSFIGTVTNGFARFAADNQPAKGADHVAFKISKDGDLIALFPAGNGPAIDIVSFGPQSHDVSEGRFPDGATNVIRFPRTPSPAAANFLPLEQVVISEALTHTDLPFEDAIELQNLSSEPADVSGWYLSDSNGDLKKFRLPPGSVLAPGGFGVFYEYQFNPEPGRGQSFSLSSAKGDRILLSTGDAGGNLTGYRASVSFGPAANAVSFGRYETSVEPEFVPMSSRSLGADSPANIDQFRTGAGLTNPAPRVGPVVLHEIMYHPPDVGTNDNVLDEFVELRNISTGSVPLFDPDNPTNTWRLRGGIDFEFPPGSSMAAGTYLLLVSFSPTNTAQLLAFRTRYSVPAQTPVFGPYRGKLDNSSDSIELLMPDPPQLPPSPDAGLVPFVQVERVKYRDSAPWPALADGNTNGVGYSLQRRLGSGYGNDPINWLAGAPTPGAPTGVAAAVLPAITTPPSSQIAPEESAVQFAVIATGAAPLSYQWRFNGQPIRGATNAALLLQDVRPANEGRYAVLVSDPAGAVSSAQVTLRLQTPPILLVEPQDRTVLAGAPAAFSVSARGSSPLAYQWRRDGAALAGQTGTNLTINAVQPANEGAYTVVITNSYGAVTSRVAQLTINTPPLITAQPQSLIVNAGDPASFSVGVGGSQPLRYQWSFNGSVIPGEINSTLVLNNVQGGSAGNYSVRVTNAVGSATSAVATLAVVLPPVVSIVAVDPGASEAGLNPGLFVVTRSYATNTPLSVNLSIEGTATSGLDYTAISTPVVIPASQTSANIVIAPLDDGLKESPETVTLTLAPGFRYAVGALNSATVTIFDNDNQPPVVAITQPADRSVFPLTPTNLTVTATANDPDGTVAQVEFFWAGTNKIGQSFGPVFSITWQDAPAGSNALIAVATDNLGGAITSAPVYLVLNAQPVVALTSPPDNSGFRLGTNITLAASATDSDGSVTQVQFFVDEILLATDLAPPFTATWPSPEIGSYGLTARATDNRGASTVSDLVNVFVNTGFPAFTDAFAARNTVTGSPLTIVGSNTTSTAESGEPDPVGARNNRTVWIAWTSPSTGRAVVDTFGSFFDTVLAVYSGGNLGSQALLGANDDTGSLQSQVTFNAVGGTTYNIQVAGFSSSDNVGAITLHITAALAPPFIALQPQNRTAFPGSNVTFSVGVFGTAPLRYQWRFNGIELPGAVSSVLALNNVQISSEGAYSVLVTNFLGAVTSAVATLTIDDGLVSTRRLTLVPLHQDWRYNQTGVDPGPPWRVPGFDDSTWPIGQTLFGFEDTVPSPYFEPFRTPLRQGSAGGPVTTLFRTHFSFTNAPGTITLLSSNWVDDGAIFYLNGDEAGRLRMLAGVSNFFTLAQNVVPEGQTNVLAFPASSLVAGDNVLAVEVHQSSFGNVDVVFGMTLDATIVVTNAPALIQALRLPSGAFQVTISGLPGRVHALDVAAPLGAPWSTLTTFSNFTGQATYLDTAGTNGAARFYRARVVR